MSLSKQVRRVLDDAGLEYVRIFVSGGLDEDAVETLLGASAPIDAFGIGTRMNVSADAPYFDMAYKIVTYAGRKVLKLSAGTTSRRSSCRRWRRPASRLRSPCIAGAGTRPVAARSRQRSIPSPASRAWCWTPGRPGPEVTGLSAVSRLPRSIAERQRRQAEERLQAAGLTAAIAVEEDQQALGPGTLLFLALRGRAGFSALGRRGLPAERVADLAVDELLAWIASGAAVDEHLADQLVPFLALVASGSTFTCPRLSPHLQTVVGLVRHFVPARIALENGRPARIRIEPAAAASR